MESFFLLYMSPIFLLMIAWETWHAYRHKHPVYHWHDTFTNTVLALLHQFSDFISVLCLSRFFLWIYQHRLWTLPNHFSYLFLLIVLQDFMYYWFHRASHRIRWLWASHVTHHSSVYLNLSTAFRQSLTYPLSGMWIFWLPLIALGFQPRLVISVVAINLGLQFFVHTQMVTNLGWLEYLINTPSHHRVHHASNPEYIDHNYAGIFIIWDKLFGTFTKEQARIPCRYGIVHPIQSSNPLVLTFHEWQKMLADFLQKNPLWLRFKHLWCTPEWAAEQDQKKNIITFQ